MPARLTGTAGLDTTSSLVGWRSPAILALIVYLLLPSQPSVHAQDDSGYRLEVRPSICVTLENGSVCSVEIEIRWTAPGVRDVCVKLEDGMDALRCWQQQRSGEMTMELERNHGAVLQLLSQPDNTVVEEAEVSVVSRDLRDSRRRRRHVWSIL